MKIPGKNALTAAAMFLMMAAACWGCVWAYANHMPGKGGGSLEFRLAAIDAEHLGGFSPSPTGADIFSGPEARKIAQSGDAPAGFEWLPISEIVGRFNLIQPRGITRMVNGQDFLLVADQPGMILTHAANFPPWGVKSVIISSTYKFGPVVRTVQVHLDRTGDGLLQRFTERLWGHSLAVILDGQVIANLGLLSPVRHYLPLSYPEGGQSEATKLRDLLMM